jgi:hypothetical protein
MITPPRFASWLLQTALPCPEGEAIAGDLYEEFGTHIVPARGLVAARWWYRWQVARSLAPLFFRSWQRASATRASAALITAAVVAMLPATALLWIRAFALSQVPLKTTPEMSVLFAAALFGVVVVTALIGFAAGAHLLRGRDPGQR